MTTELAPPRGHGLVRIAHSLRIDVSAPFWQSLPGTDFWVVAGGADPVTASAATNLSGLDSFGWTTTSVVNTNSVTADFMSSADDTPPNWSANATADVLRSPIIFGNHSHRLLVGQKLGYLPTKLVADFYGAFLTASADESATNMGFHNGAAIVMAVYSNAVNFLLSNGVTTLTGPAVDNAYHQWRISIDVGTGLATFTVDGTSYGTLAVTQDVWPAAFGWVASTTNRPALAWAHIWYE